MLSFSLLALLLLPSSILGGPADNAASITLTTASSPANPPSPTVTGLTPSQQSALNNYLKSLRDKSGFKSVENEVSIALPASALQVQEASFRDQVVTATGTVIPVPPYVTGMPPNAQTYLSSYYAAQASILNQNFAVQSSETARAQLGEKVTTAVGGSSTTAPSVGKQNSTMTAITTSKAPDASSTTTDDHQTTDKPSDSSSETASATSSTAKSSSSSALAPRSQPTGVVVRAAAGVVAAGMMGVAALL